MRRILMMVLFSALLYPSLTHAQCSKDDTFGKCWLSLVTEGIEASSEGELLSQQTTVDTAGENLSTNKKDFLPLLSMAALIGEDAQESTDGTVALDLNPLLPFRLKTFSYQLQGVFNTEPEVFEALKAKLPEDSRDDQIKELQGTFGDLSDYAINLSINLETSQLGRRFQQHRDLFAGMAKIVSDRANPSGGLASLGDVVTQNSDLFAKIESDETKLNVLTDQERELLVNLLRGPASMEGRSFAARNQEFHLTGLDRFDDLLNNQPQVYFTVQKHLRDPFAGHDETSIKGTWEWSNVSLNKAVKKCRANIDDACLKEYRDYVTLHEDDMEGDLRFAVSLERVEIEDLEVDLPFDDIEDPRFQGAERWTGGAGVSRVFQATPQAEPIRMDFLARYEKVSGDPMRQKTRFVANLTLTRKFGDITVPFGLVYANHTEFLTDSDDQLSAHLGVKFDLDLPETDQ